MNMISLTTLIAHNMREGRHALGLSQAALAEKIHTSTNYIAMIELGRKAPSLPMAERIAAALEIEPAELFSMRSIPLESIQKLHSDILLDIDKAITGVIAKNFKDFEHKEGKESKK
jgi:transcriptional regulator with XRE-family HTH domain